MAIKDHKKKVGAVALAAGLVAGFEGLRTVAYRDPIGIPTACFGETRGVHMGQAYTVDQCKQMLGDRLEEFDRGVMACIHVAITPAQEAASISLAYNIGVGAFCKSSVARKFNGGDPRGACDAFRLFNRAAGIVMPGLTRRREAERRLCLTGLD